MADVVVVLVMVLVMVIVWLVPCKAMTNYQFNVVCWLPMSVFVFVLVVGDSCSGRTILS